MSGNARLALAVIALAVALPVSALTIHDNFGPDHGGFDYNWGLGWTVAGADVPAQFLDVDMVPGHAGSGLGQASCSLALAASETISTWTDAGTGL